MGQATSGAAYFPVQKRIKLGSLVRTGLSEWDRWDLKVKTRREAVVNCAGSRAAAPVEVAQE
jgi:hypothetical protein